MFGDGRCKGKNAVKDGVLAFKCLLNCLRFSLLGFSSFCLALSIDIRCIPLFAREARVRRRTDAVHDTFDSVAGGFIL